MGGGEKGMALAKVTCTENDLKCDNECKLERSGNIVYVKCKREKTYFTFKKGIKTIIKWEKIFHI